jgi:excisionase family DNA binding protein
VDESRRLAPVVSIQQQVTYPALTDRFLTAQDAADLLRVARDTIYAWCKAGYLPSVRIGGSYRIRPSDLQALRLPPAPSPIRGATAANAAKTHCPKGHVLDGLRSDGHRYCKTCNNLREKARREKKGGTR